jgi:hypothetical protein
VEIDFSNEKNRMLLHFFCLYEEVYEEIGVAKHKSFGHCVLDVKENFGTYG